jgi:hypothetical protein
MRVLKPQMIQNHAGGKVPLEASPEHPKTSQCGLLQPGAPEFGEFGVRTGIDIIANASTVERGG